MSAEKTVEIGIRTTADLTAAKEASVEIKNVGAAAEGAAKQLASTNLSAEGLAKLFAEANARSSEWAATLQKLNNEQLLEVEERLRSQIKTQQELGQNADELKAKLTAAYSQRTGDLDQSLSKTAAGARDAAHAGGQLTGSLTEVRGAAKGTHEVMEGLERGGIGGLIKAGKGLKEIFHSLAGGALTGVFIPAVLAAGGAIIALRKHGEKLEEENKKAFEAQAKRSERIKAEYEEIAKAAEKTAEAQIKAVEKVIASYDEYLARLERGDARLKESIKLQTDAKAAGIDRDEQRALAAAKNPEQREKVAKNFEQQRATLKNSSANAEIIDSATNARLRLDRNNEETSKLQAERDAVQRNLEDKKKAEADARTELSEASNIARREGRDISTDQRTKEARENANRAARETADAQKKNTEVQAGFKTASERIADENAAASSQLENARTRGQTRASELEADSAKRLNEAKPERERLKKEAQDALEHGDSAGQDKAVKQLQLLEKTVAAATAENTRAIKELTAALGAQRGLAPAAVDAGASKPDVTISNDGEVVAGPAAGKAKREATVEIDGVKQSLDSALKESRAKDVAFVTFANTVAEDSKTTRKQVEKTERQIANSR